MLIHSLLLNLTFGGQGLGRPGFGFPWGDRRIEVPDLRLLLVPTHISEGEPVNASVAEPLQQAPIEQPVASAPPPIPSVSPTPRPGTKEAAMVPAAQPTAEAKSRRDTAAGADPAKASLRADRPGDAAPQIPDPPLIDVGSPGEAASVVPTAPSVSAAVIAVGPPSASSRDTETSAFRKAPDVAQEAARSASAQIEAQRQKTARQDEEARVEVARLEVERQEAERPIAAQPEAQRQEAARQEESARVEAARQEAERSEAERLAAAQLAAQRQKVARQEEETARVETARREAERQEAERLAAAQLEAQRQKVARQAEEEARVETARREAERQEAERHEAERRAAPEVEAQRQEPARPPGASQESGRARADQEEEKREARLRAIGRQLDEEAARREEPPTSARARSTLPLSLSTARRVRLWGRAHPNVELIRYSEAWEQKIQFNTPIDTVRQIAARLRTSPMVTVAIRNDGSVESVTFSLSSGVAEVDEAIRRVVRSLEHYQAFPPELARDYDVIEIRRTWHFDVAVRLY